MSLHTLTLQMKISANWTSNHVGSAVPNVCVLLQCVVIMRGRVGAWASPAAELAASQSPEVQRLSQLQYPETNILNRGGCSFKGQFVVQETHSHLEITIIVWKQITTWNILAELLEAFTVDAGKKGIFKSYSTKTLFPCPLPPSYSLNWTTNKVSFGGVAAHGCPPAAWPAKEPISWWAPNQTTRVSLWHVAHNIHLLSWGWLGHWAMFWEHHKDAAQLLSVYLSICLSLSLSLSVCPLHLPLAISTGVPLFCVPLRSVRASWACYPNPTVVAEFVSLTKGPALYTCQGANDSNKQGPGKRGGQASAVLLSFTGFLAAALPWKLGNPQSASLMSDDALSLMVTLEKHTRKEK